MLLMCIQIIRLDICSKVMAFIINMIILTASFQGKLACDFSCPSDKPFCSDVGCISDCPEPFYINGSDCVGDCGKLFVTMQRACVENCPNNTYIKDTLKQTYTKQYLERKCISCLNKNEYIMNQTCVNMCPENWRTIDYHHCTTKCPTTRPFKLKKTISDLLHYICVGKCPYFEENSFCVEICSKNRVKFGSSCLINCPPSNPILLSNECISECPSTEIFNGPGNSTCIFQCPVDKPFVSTSRCVSQCPEIAKLRMYKNGLNICTDKCGNGNFVYNESCLNSCPASTVAVDNSCINSCPVDLPFTCMVEKGHVCGTGSKENLDHAVCVQNCPSNMFISNRSCVYTCPHGMPSFNKECSDVCPVDNPYRYKSTITEGCYRYINSCEKVRYLLKCTDKCSRTSYLFNKSCELYCPEGTFYDDNTCVEQCPLSKTYILNSSLTYDIWKKGKAWRSKFYREKQLIGIQKCVSSCPGGNLLYNFTCVDSCPKESRFVRNMTCTRDNCDTQYIYNNRSGIFCTETCETYDFRLNSTCVQSCPETYTVFNENCVEKCPSSHPYFFRSVLGKTCLYTKKCLALKEVVTCVSKCPNNSYIQNTNCLSFCPKPLITYKNKCVRSCPVSSKFIDKSIIMIKGWKRKSGSQLLEGHEIKKSILKCVSACPAKKVAVGLTCDATCPVHSRFIYNGSCTTGPCNTTFTRYSSSGILCTNTCPSGTFGYNKTCVLQCPDGHFSLDQNCVTECSKQKFIVNNETTRSRNCNHFSGTCELKFRYDIQCRHDCPQNKFLWNNTCLDVCPHDMIIFNKTCIMKCPNTHLYIKRHYIQVTYWNFSFNHNGYIETTEDRQVKECVQNCAKFKSGNICVEQCPSTRSYLNGDKCLSSCPDGTLADLKEKKCVENCPNDMIKQGHTCRIICGNNLLYKNGECVHHYECKEKSFEFAGQCLHNCPDGFVWFVSCVNVLAVGLCVPVLFIPTIGLVILGRHIFIDLLTIIRLTFIKEDQLTEYLTKKHMQRPIKAAAQTPRKEEEVLLLEDMDSSDEELLLFTRTRCRIIDGDVETVL